MTAAPPVGAKSISMLAKLATCATYGVPSILSFLISFGSPLAEVPNPIERTVYGVIAASVSAVLIRFITKLPEIMERMTARKKSREDILAAANDRLIQSLQATLDVARLRADTAEEARELEKASKHLLQSFYGNACNHLQIRAGLLSAAEVEYPEFKFTEVIELMKPWDDRIRVLMAAKTAVSREVVSKSTAQPISVQNNQP